MTKKDSEVPGNAMASQQAYTRQLVRQAELLLRWEGIVNRLEDEEVWVDGLSIRMPTYDRPDTFVTVRAHTPTGKIVAFHGAPTLYEAVAGVVARVENRTLKWREDQYG
jgi:hypothetical protein